MAKKKAKTSSATTANVIDGKAEISGLFRQLARDIVKAGAVSIRRLKPKHREAVRRLAEAATNLAAAQFAMDRAMELATAVLNEEDG